MHRRWETETRYYETIVNTDLWGECVLVTVWGGKSSRLGGCRTVAIGEENVIKRLTHIQDERRKHGYVEAICKHIDDLEDLYLEERQLEAIRAEKSGVWGAMQQGGQLTANP